MSRPLRRWVPRPGAVGLRAWRGAAAFGAMAVALAIVPLTAAPSQASSRPPRAAPALAVAVPPGAGPASGLAGLQKPGKGAGFRRIILPDLAVIEPHGLTTAKVAALGKL